MATIGVSLPTFCGEAFDREYVSMAELGRWVRACEKTGVTTLWHVDRLGSKAPPAYNCSWYEPLITLSIASTFSEKMRVGTGILNITYRNPIILAKEVATIDRLTGGRLILGLGQGWNRDELEACNVPISRRGRVFEEAVTLLRLLLERDVVTFEGDFWRVRDFSLEPRPHQRPRPPILLAGGGNGIHFKTETDISSKLNVFRRCAALGDGWIARTDTSVEELRTAIDVITQELKMVGRRVEEFTFAHQNFVFVIGRSGDLEDARERFKKISLRPFDYIIGRYVIGRPDEVVERIKSEMEVGIDHFIVMPTFLDYGLLDFLSDELVPAVSLKS
ncbi:MAG: TIGR03619 family F420-dependent LLM class oxidoreductase [Aigarchaeota archaeon]|nr:TIGR03619 family F420-dependent LLM class oxidoreductase [Aigarchaeota archaeon]MDW8092815.1 TIGR03619 family F420-dependent LLM class oxidoreductase [Nitrososphaerota archaeon]